MRSAGQLMITKESCTNAWIKLINQLEKDKCGNIFYENEEKSSKTCYNIDGGKQHALADKGVVPRCPVGKGL